MSPNLLNLFFVCLFCCSAWLLFITPASDLLICFQLLLVYYFFPPVNFQVIEFFLSNGSFFIFSYVLKVSVSVRFSTLFSSSTSIFMIITVNSLPGILLMSISFSSFVLIVSWLSFGTYFSFSLFCLNLFVWFYALGNSARSPDLENSVLMKKRSCSTI